MCGIAGFLTKDSTAFDSYYVIKRMTKTLNHRGPDGEGIEVFQSPKFGCVTALGHRRLKIIDLSEKARQPMFNDDKNLSIVFNGELYNYLELKEELLAKGYNFFSSSDTEVILNAYAEWGTGCFERFNGMWALAIFDKKKKKIILSRDRFGKKPLYYYKTSGEFIFASEIKAILKYPGVLRKPNHDKIYRYIARNYRYVDIDEKSFFDNIDQIPKSSYVEIDEYLNITARKYWQIDPPLIKEEIDEKEAIDTFRDRLMDAVKIRLRSDVPVGCMLSGGLDSTSITSIAYKVFNKRIIAFSGITGEEKGVYDESDYINSVIRETNANFHYIRPEPADVVDTVDEMLYYHDEPVCTVTWYNLYLIAKKISKEKVPVILNGHAGDELLAGYWEHYHYNFYELDKSGNTKELEHEISCWKQNHGRAPSEIEKYRSYINDLEGGRTAEVDRFSDYSYCFKEEIIKKYHRKISLENGYTNLLNRRLYSELFYETVPASLRPEDRNTMSQSIESRSPFLDYKLAEFCFSLPNKFKIRNGVGKWILREAMKGILPEDVRTRKDKAGFIAPADEWFRTINKKQIFDIINSDSFNSRNLFNINRVNEMFKEHVERKKNHQMVLWQIINLELWFRRFFDE